VKLPTEPPDNIVALSRYRAQLSRGQRSRRIESLFDAENPPAAIAALPPDEFFYILHELGFPEALDVLVHGTAEQVQCALDFSIWDKDSLSVEKANEWLGAIAAGPVEVIGRWVKELDIELLSLLVRQRARIYDLSLEEVADECEGVLWNSPDGNFTLEFLGEPNEARVTQHLVDSIYRFSPTMARKMLVGMRSELDSDLEEMALRWRNGRMADLGFSDYYEALEVYRELDPAAVMVGDKPIERVRPIGDEEAVEALRLPSVMAERMTMKTPFARSVATIQDSKLLADVHFALVALCNRALAADRIIPGDDAAVRHGLERVAATLDLGVEFLSRHDQDLEARIIRSVPVIKLFRLGHSLLLKLQRLARSLTHGTQFAALRPQINLFDLEQQGVLESLARLRPVFPRSLDPIPATGERPFATLADVTRATLALEEAGAIVEMVLGLGIRPEHICPERLALIGGEHPIDPLSVDAGVLARTVLVRYVLGVPKTPIEPLKNELVKQFNKNFINDNQLSDIAKNNCMDIVLKSTRSKTLEGAQRRVAEKWIASLAPLAATLGQEKV
jgi:hypothetical protein